MILMYTKEGVDVELLRLFNTNFMSLSPLNPMVIFTHMCVDG